MHLVLAIHGFNVSYRKGVRSAARLEEHLQLGPGYAFAGVLWPGDAKIPVINYAAEAADAVQCGKGLARFINTQCAGASKVSLVSHSLGGRILLETLKHLDRKAHLACLTAGAVDNDVFAKQYSSVADKADNIHVLASRKDMVLLLAYPAGDFLSDVFYDDDSPFNGALGRDGSRPRRDLDSQIPGALKYGHGNYFPPAQPGSGDDDQRWREVGGYIKRCILAQPHAWPPAGKP